MNNKFKYPIMPDRTYTLKYEDFEGEVTGEEILLIFRRSLWMDKILWEMNQIPPEFLEPPRPI